MGLYSNFPYTNFHEMNLDWILRELKELVDEWDSFGGNVTSEAHVSTTPEVTVSGNLKTGLNFNFGLVEGPRGQAGPEGPEGPQGKGLEILGVYTTLSDLRTAHPTGSVGDIYLVGSNNNYVMYVWNEDVNDWSEGGALTSPSPSTSTPLMDGVASAGASTVYSRGDHVHPSDTSKQDILVSGTNIKTLDGYNLLGAGDVSLKTVNNETLTGTGDIEVQETLVSGTNIKTVNSNSLLGQGDITVQETLVSGTNIKTVNSNSLLGQGDIAVQETLVSGTNIKTVNNQSLLGSGDIAISGGSITFDLLWSNSSVGTSFSGQTVSLDLSTYKAVGIVVNYSVSKQSPSSLQLIPKDSLEYGLIVTSTPETTTTSVRKVTVSDQGVTFTEGYAGSGSNNTGAIPVRIYGIK